MKKIFGLLFILVISMSLFVACKDNDNDQDNDNINDPIEVMTYAEYMAAEVDSKVKIEAYVQATQGWWADEIIAYLQDKDGGYYVYKIRCSEEDAAKLTKGTKVQVQGFKANWGGEVEITDATFTLVDTEETWIAPATDVTALLGTDELMKHQNKLVKYTDMEIKSISYKNGEPGDDIYVTFNKGGVDYSCTVEVYLTGTDSEVYQTVATLAAGDVVDVEGFLQSYENKPDTHITSISKVLTYDEYIAAEVDTKVTVEAYVQATQGWWADEIIAYLQDKDGGYYVYKIRCSEEEAEKLTKGTKVHVTGYKANWGGEVEIVDATFACMDAEDTWIATPTDVTALLGTDELMKHQNKLVKYTDMEIKSITYKNGEPGDDIYVTFTKGGVDYSFTVEVYLTGTDSEVYQTVATLAAGDVVDVEGFLQSYENKPDTHITSILKVVSYEEYMAAEVDTKVAVEAYVQATQSWWADEIIAYLQDENGGYYVYKIRCTEAEAAKLIKGTKVRVTGYKAIWGGEVEITDATFTLVDTEQTWIATATDVTALLGTDELMKHQNKLVKYTDMTIKSITYKNDEPGDDIWVTFTKNGADYSFTVEIYLTGADTEVYKAFADLKAGDVVDVEGFLQSYENKPDTHITSVTKK